MGRSEVKAFEEEALWEGGPPFIVKLGDGVFYLDMKIQKREFKEGGTNKRDVAADQLLTLTVYRAGRGPLGRGRIVGQLQIRALSVRSGATKEQARRELPPQRSGWAPQGEARFFARPLSSRNKVLRAQETLITRGTSTARC